jgi:hypothetical protein
VHFFVELFGKEQNFQELESTGFGLFSSSCIGEGLSGIWLLLSGSGWIRKRLDLVEEGEKRVTQLMKKAAIAESREQRNSVEGIVVPVGKHAW